jgi:tRNA(Leu) C34 or U34 (ribose-2'-O)-methylase TrmL
VSAAGSPRQARGFYGIGIVGSKTAVNVGTLWRSAASLDAGFIFTAGRRYPKQASDTVKAWKHVPMFEFIHGEDLFEHLPKDCVPVAVEITPDARPLAAYVHPERACYILGAEDGGMPRRVLDRCRDVIQLPGSHCLNVAVAGSIVMYDRIVKGSIAQPVERRSTHMVPCPLPEGSKARGLPEDHQPQQWGGLGRAKPPGLGGRVITEAQVELLRDLARFGTEGQILRLGGEKCRELVALCDSWLAQRDVVAAATRIVNEATYVEAHTDGSVTVEVEATYWSALVAAVVSGTPTYE